MIRRPPRSTLSSSSAASDVYKRQARAWQNPQCRSLSIPTSLTLALHLDILTLRPHTLSSHTSTRSLKAAGFTHTRSAAGITSGHPPACSERPPSASFSHRHLHWLTGRTPQRATHLPQLATSCPVEQEELCIIKTERTLARSEAVGFVFVLPTSNKEDSAQPASTLSDSRFGKHETLEARIAEWSKLFFCGRFTTPPRAVRLRLSDHLTVITQHRRKPGFA